MSGDAGGLGDPGAGEGYDESRDALDLSPRTTATHPGPPPSRSRRRPVGAYLALAAVVLGVAFVVMQGLGDATLYFRNVDEAVADRDDLGTRRFRLQGLVRDDVEQDGERVTFTLTFNGVDVAVRHAGDPPDLFRPGQPVVLEGRFEEGSDVYLSDSIRVKHSEEYEAEHEDDIRDAQDGEAGLASQRHGPSG